ncbi:hemerythrin domain-containing protein [Roseomonas aeriglobus]|nr:hemerythrin domain-containing protein [Roseomonas aeriglobus]
MATTEANREKTSDTNGNLGKLAGAATAGVALGVLAMIARKAAVQAPTYMAGDWDEALAAEHKAVLKLFDALEATEPEATTKRTILLTQMKHALAKHALEEENTIYPALREAGEVAGADELNAEHGYVKQYLYELENMPNNGDAFLDKVRKFRADIEDHMREEEQELFPKLKAKLSPERNKQLTMAMNKEGFKLA